MTPGLGAGQAQGWVAWADLAARVGGASLAVGGTKRRINKVAQISNAATTYRMLGLIKSATGQLTTGLWAPCQNLLAAAPPPPR